MNPRSFTPGDHLRAVAIAAIVAFAAFAAAPSVAAPVLPNGFALELMVAEPFVGQPVGFARLPDGRIVLIERPTGIVRIAAVGAAVSDSIGIVPGVEGVHLERGLLGVAVDPEWPDRPFLYLYYTHLSGFSRLTMFTATGALSNPSSTAITLGSPYHLLTDLSDANGIHNGGALRFAPDGRLLLALGEDALACQAQTLDSLIGGILRLDVSSMPGVGPGPPAKSEITPADNPFVGLGDNAQLRYAWGLRNPFRFTIDAPTGRLVIGDVGSSFFEEINVLDPATEAGANFGWPQLEGHAPIFCCGDCGLGNPFTAPVHVFEHPTGGVSIVAGPIVRTQPASPVGFPPSYEGDLLYFEFFSGVARRLVESAGTWSIAPLVPGQPDPENWATGIFGISDVQLAPDGALEMVALGFGETQRGFYRLTGSGATGVPLLSAPHAAGSLELRAAPNPAAAGTAVTFTLVRPGDRPGAASGAALLDASIDHVEIDDVRGRLVRRIAAASGDGAASISWDGRGDDGRRAAPGVYFARARAASGTIAVERITILR